MIDSTPNSPSRGRRRRCWSASVAATASTPTLTPRKATTRSRRRCRGKYTATRSEDGDGIGAVHQSGGHEGLQVGVFDHPARWVCAGSLMLLCVVCGGGSVAGEVGVRRVHVEAEPPVEAHRRVVVRAPPGGGSVRCPPAQVRRQSGGEVRGQSAPSVCRVGPHRAQPRPPCADPHTCQRDWPSCRPHRRLAVRALWRQPRPPAGCSRRRLVGCPSRTASVAPATVARVQPVRRQPLPRR